jgi:GTP-binding protein Era
MTENNHVKTRCGFVALIGAPNVGKSTLVNALVGSKVSIVSPKVQTTRTTVRGILIEGASQVVFVDTPGIFKPEQTLERAIVNAAWQGIGEADLIALVVDAKRGICRNTRLVIRSLKEQHAKACLIINKIDTVKPHELLPLTKELHDLFAFEQTFMISALKRDGVADIRRYFASVVAEGPWLYPEDQISDAPLRFLAAEIVREQLFIQLHEELPYHLTVSTEHIEEMEKGSLKIHVVIYVTRESQKQIIVGKRGAMIRSVGEKARQELNVVLGQLVHLFTFVKVKKDWLDRPEIYREMGIEFPK